MPLAKDLSSEQRDNTLLSGFIGTALFNNFIYSLTKSDSGIVL
jgi:hypothetical protein